MSTTRSAGRVPPWSRPTASGATAIGCDVSAFNCQLAEVKTATYDVEHLAGALEATLERALDDAPPDEGVAGRHRPGRDASTPWLREWLAPRALAELAGYRAATRSLGAPVCALAEVVLSRAARSARLTTHFDLDFPKAPVHRPYLCHKHKRTCRPVEEAAKFLRRYTADVVRRVDEYARLRTSTEVAVLHDDARHVTLPFARPTA